MSFTSNQRCGIILAGGKGRRLRPFIHQLKGTTLPKQYVNFIGARSLLEHTFDRAERLISRDHLMTVITRDHLNYHQVEQQLSSRFAGTVMVQPEDRGTGPGILLPLMHLCKRYPDATVAVFPSDQFILEEDVFMAHVGMAFYLVENNPSHLVLLGVEPDSPAPEYGYVLPDGAARDVALAGLRGVQVFMNDLDSVMARELIAGGGLWNTMTMVFKAETVLDLVRTFIPRLYGLFQDIYKAIGTRKELAMVEEAYRRMKPMDFAEGILQTFVLLRPSQLSVLPVSEVFWSDWGSEQSVLGALRQTGYLGRLQRAAVEESQSGRSISVN
jgi:mannose-1-phosphate guanylyltransferase